MVAEVELYTELHERITSLGYDVYPYKNDKGFPFVQLGETFNDEEETNKTRIGGRVTQFIHIWHNELNEKGTVSTMAHNIIKTIRDVKRTQSYQWRIPPRGITASNTINETANVRLRHYLIEVEIQYY